MLQAKVLHKSQWKYSKNKILTSHLLNRTIVFIIEDTDICVGLNKQDDKWLANIQTIDKINHILEASKSGIVFRVQNKNCTIL